MVNNELLLEYVDVEFKWTKNGPKLKLTLKSNKKLTEIPKYKKTGQPVSGAQLDYWTNYLGIDVGTDVYNERRKLFSKTTALRWYIDTFNPAYKGEIQDYIDSIKSKISNSLTKHYNSELGNETKKKLRKRSEKWASVIGEKNKERWNDHTWKNNEMERRKQSGHYKSVSKHNIERMNDPIFVDKFNKACNEPERTKKISESSKQMWKDAKKNDKDKYYRMISSNKNRTYELDGHKMYSIEYTIGQMLNTIGIKWEYEKMFTYDTNTYLPDFYLPEFNIIIECFGDFWHANPKFMKPTDTTHKHIQAVDVWSRDETKLKHLSTLVDNVIVFWEHDINTNLNQCEDLLLERIKKENINGK